MATQNTSNNGNVRLSITHNRKLIRKAWNGRVRPTIKISFFPELLLNVMWTKPAVAWRRQMWGTGARLYITEAVML